MIYTSHGLMTAADLEEYRQDTDWYELHGRPQEDEACVHGRLLTEDCDECEQECAGLAEPSGPRRWRGADPFIDPQGGVVTKQQQQERQYTDPPTMPEDERMTPAEFRVIREFLGLTGDWLAQHLDVNPRTVRAWEQGRYSIPDGVRLQIEDVERRTNDFVAACIEQIMDMPDPAVVTYRSDDEYHAAHPEISFPASWHRAVVARIAQEVPGLVIVYPNPV